MTAPLFRPLLRRGRETAVAAARLALRWLGLRWLKVSYPHRIGHLVLEPDSYLRETFAAGDRPRRLVIIEPDEGFANPTIAKYLRRYATIVRRSRLSAVLREAFEREKRVIDTAPYAVAMYDTARCFDVYRRWGQRPPLFAVSPEDRRHLEEALGRLGVPANAWFVCVHARGGGYSPSDEYAHSYRNVAIEDYGPAMDLIAARGGWCIRMGDPSMAPMAARPHCIDYALSEHRSETLDVLLSASCRFFLGCSSGLYNVAAMFGRPSALANTAPLAAAYSQGVDDLAIPQRLRTADGQLLSFEDIFASDVANLRITPEFEARKLVPLNVTPSEIAAMTAEMCDRLDGTARYSAEDEDRQNVFRGFLRPGHYAYGTGSRIGRDYLRDHLSPTAG